MLEHSLPLPIEDLHHAGLYVIFGIVARGLGAGAHLLVYTATQAVFADGGLVEIPDLGAWVPVGEILQCLCSIEEVASRKEVCLWFR